MSQQPKRSWPSSISITPQSAPEQPQSFELISEEPEAPKSGNCPGCGAAINAPPHFAGLTIVCKGCQKKFKFSPTPKQQTVQTGLAVKIAAALQSKDEQIASLTAELETVRRSSADKITRLEAAMETLRAEHAAKVAVLNSDRKADDDSTFYVDHSDPLVSAQDCILELRKMVVSCTRELNALHTVVGQIEAAAK